MCCCVLRRITFGQKVDTRCMSPNVKNENVEEVVSFKVHGRKLSMNVFPFFQITKNLDFVRSLARPSILGVFQSKPHPSTLPARI